MSRNGKILIVLLGVLVITVIYRVLNPFQQQTVAKLKYARHVDGKATPSFTIHTGEKKKLSDQEVLIDLFINPPRHSDKTVKNIFYLFKAQGGQAKEYITRPDVAEMAQSSIVQKPDPYAQINEDIRRFTIFGIYEKNKEKIVFLEKEKDVLMVREGDRIEGKYRVERITDQQVVIKEENSNASVTIDIQGI